MSTIAERLQLIIDERFTGSRTKFAIKAECNPTTIANYLVPTKKSKPSSDILAKIVLNVGVDAHWLLTGQGQPFGTISGTGNNSILIHADNNAAVSHVKNNSEKDDNAVILALCDTIKSRDKQISQLLDIIDKLNK